MNARNCKNCGRLFNYIAGPPMCPVCREDIEKKFQQVKEYVSNNANCSVALVAEECEVSEKQIKQSDLLQGEYLWTIRRYIFHPVPSV